MQTEELKGIVEDAWEARDSVDPANSGDTRQAHARGSPATT